MSAPSVVIVDYGVGNLFSVERALKKIGSSRVVISNDRSVILDADRLVLPGVGAFGDGMRNLAELGLVSAIADYAASGRPVLGVCLGMQLLMSVSEEFGTHEGLDLVPGRVTQLQPPADLHFKVPQIGWNSLNLPNGQAVQQDPWKETVLRDLEEGSFMYFLHSYIVVPDDPGVCTAMTAYGHDRFCSVLRQGNISGVQFHPERSAENGLSIYRSFIYDS